MGPGSDDEGRDHAFSIGVNLGSEAEGMGAAASAREWSDGDEDIVTEPLDAAVRYTCVAD